MRLTEDSHLADIRVAEYFLREQASRERKPTGPAAAPERQPMITISRQFGAGGHTVGDRLAAELGEPWQVWDREIIDAVAESAHVRREMVEAMDDHIQSWLDQAVRNITNVPSSIRAPTGGISCRSCLLSDSRDARSFLAVGHA